MPDPVTLRPWKAQKMDFSLGENVRNVWRWTAPHGVKVSEVMEPERWSHLARDLRAGDKIEIRAADGSFYVETLVTAVVGLLVHLRPLVKWEPTDAEAEPSEETVEVVTGSGRVQWVAGGDHKWRVVNAAGEIVSKGHATRAEAEEKLAEYARETGRAA